VPHPRYTSSEIVQRGQALYDQQIRDQIDPGAKGKFLVLNIETGEYELDADELAALRRAKVKHPDAPLYSARRRCDGIQTRGKECGGRPMIMGSVTSNKEALIRIVVRGSEPCHL